jgi:hypothetical protein
LIHGEIKSGDQIKFKKEVHKFTNSKGLYTVGKVYLLSPGGDVAAAEDIGRQIRLLRASTYAPFLVSSGLWKQTYEPFLIPGLSKDVRNAVRGFRDADRWQNWARSKDWRHCSYGYDTGAAHPRTNFVFNSKTAEFAWPDDSIIGGTKRYAKITDLDWATWEDEPSIRTVEIIPSNCECASACFLIWASGVGRFGDVVGVHRWRFNSKGWFSNLTITEAVKLYAELSAGIKAYLQEMNVPENIVNLMFSASSAEMTYLEPNDIRQLANADPGRAELVISKCGLWRDVFRKGKIESDWKVCEEEIRLAPRSENAANYLRAYPK